MKENKQPVPETGATAPYPGEGEKAYAAFLAYKNCGDRRNYDEAAKTVGKSVTLIKRGGSKYRWQDRIRSWLREIDRDKNALVAERISEMVSRQLDLATTLELRVAERLGKMKASELTPSDCVKMLSLAVAMERTALGLDGTLKIGKVKAHEFVRPDGDIVSDAVRALAPIDRALLRDLSIKQMQIYALEAELAQEAKSKAGAIEMPQLTEGNNESTTVAPAGE